MPYILKLKHHFESSHQLHGHDGPCGRQHGHRWEIEVRIETNRLQNDMVADFDSIKQMIDQFDHVNLNEVVDFNPTAENLARHLKETIDGETGLSSEVTLWESPTAGITYK